jgi:chemotaxis signal transduction protein
MATKFKGVDLADDLKGVIAHVAAAEEYGGALQHLQSVWDNLTLLGQLSGTTTDMTATRHAFNELAETLLNQLGRQALNKCLQEAGAKAQVAINILVRNLFERTADIGFLACDDAVRGFLRQDAEERDAAALRRRFGEYIRKYSVYSDIVVLDPKGKVLARFDESETTTASVDAAIREAIETTAGYVESFGTSDLFAERKRTLIYSFRVSDDGGGLLGVLRLCFRLDNEAELIFANLVGGDDWSVVTILDENGAVVASSDPVHMPLGVRLAPVLDAEYRIVRFGPVEYLAVSRAAQPYQGYRGPGWYGHVMVPLAHAFAASAAELLTDVDDAMIERIIHSSQLFNDHIRAIPAKAEHIQRELNRSVWNGNLKQGQGDGTAAGAAGAGTPAGFSKTLLKEISSTGVKTKNVFQASIMDLNTTVVSSVLHDNRFHAALAIDIMDRNLYERANDCRWWALTPAFAELLAKPQREERDAAAMRAILRTINGLYTVYSNLIVFDRAGRIVAVSDPNGAELEGTTLTDQWVGRILALRGTQAYAVSAFAPTPLYGGRPTYIYGAAIAGAERGEVVGGVAIVFDSAPQFAAMLADALPRGGSGAIKHGAFGVLAEPDGKIIACSDEHFHPGDTLALDPAFLRLAPGTSHAGFAALGDGYFAVGARASSGYREYKGITDPYRDEVIALVLTRLCGADARAVPAAAKAIAIRSDRMQVGLTEEIATFLVGARLFAARASEIIEAIDATGITALPRMPRGMAGCLMYNNEPLPVFDLLRVIEDENAGAGADRGATHVVIMVAAKGERFGVLVDGLGDIADVNEDRVRFLPGMVTAKDAFADAALAADDKADGDGGTLVVMLRAAQLYANLAAYAPVVRAA